MEIKVIDVAKATKPTSKGSYIELNVSFKDLGTGRVSGKKIMSFSNKDVFETLNAAKAGDDFTVKAEKDDKGFWQWTAITKGVSTVVENSSKGTAQSAMHSAPRSNFETPEERAQRQVYIIRQSSLSNAIATLGVGAKTHPKPDDVIGLAKKYEDYVFGKVNADVGKEDLLNFHTMLDDVPL